MDALAPETPISGLRISDADRERLVQILGTHVGAGRLTLTEFDDRVTQVYRAVTEDQARQVLADLPAPTTVPVGESLKARNDPQARANRDLLREQGLVVLNFLSSPGSGKTALLERTLSEFGQRRQIGVVVGDLQIDNDARRLSGRGGPPPREPDVDDHVVPDGRVGHERQAHPADDPAEAYGASEQPGDDAGDNAFGGDVRRESLRPQVIAVPEGMAVGVAAGGGLALLETGDRIRIDLKRGTADILIADDALAQRRSALAARGGYAYPESQTPWQELQRGDVGDYASGATLESAVKYQRLAQTVGVPRHSH